MHPLAQRADALLFRVPSQQDSPLTAKIAENAPTVTAVVAPACHREADFTHLAQFRFTVRHPLRRWRRPHLWDQCHSRSCWFRFGLALVRQPQQNRELPPLARQPQCAPQALTGHTRELHGSHFAPRLPRL